MTARERQKIEARIALLQQQKNNLEAQNAKYFQAIHETGTVFGQLTSRIDELQSLIKPKSGK